MALGIKMVTRAALSMAYSLARHKDTQINQWLISDYTPPSSKLRSDLPLLGDCSKLPSLLPSGKERNHSLIAKSVCVCAGAREGGKPPSTWCVL